MRPFLVRQSYPLQQAGHRDGELASVVIHRRRFMPAAGMPSSCICVFALVLRLDRHGAGR